MGEAEIMDVMRAGLWIAFLVSLPILTTALVIGLVIGLFQALTSIQEMTLTFVPKLAAIAVAYWLSMSFMTNLLIDFFHQHLIVAIAGG